MRNILVVTEPFSDILRWDFQDKESIKYGFCGVSDSIDERRFLTRGVIAPANKDYKDRSLVSASIKGDLVYEVYNKSHAEGIPGVIFVHTHRTAAFFSEKDEKDTETHLKVLPDFGIRFYVRIVVGKNGLVSDVHYLEKGGWERASIDYIMVYKHRGIEIVIPENSAFKPDFLIDEAIHNRTIQIGGGVEQALQMIGFLKLGVIGVGGIGNTFLHCYKHLGPKRLVLVDPDVLEKSNANRFMGYHPGDEGKPKVEISKRELLAYNPDMKVETYQERFPSVNTILALKSCDIILATPDHHWARLQASDFCSEHLKLLLSGGAGIYVDEKDMPYRLSCSTWLQLPPPLGPCLRCLGINAELPPHYEELVLEARRSYIKGFRDPGPTPASVVTLHLQCGNLLVRNILFYLSQIGDMPVPLHLVYDEIPLRFEDVTQIFKRREGCTVCGDNAFWGYGDYAPRIPRKQEMEAELEADPPMLYSEVS